MQILTQNPSKNEEIIHQRSGRKNTRQIANEPSLQCPSQCRFGNSYVLDEYGQTSSSAIFRVNRDRILETRLQAVQLKGRLIATLEIDRWRVEVIRWLALIALGHHCVKNFAWVSRGTSHLQKKVLGQAVTRAWHAVNLHGAALVADAAVRWALGRFWKIQRIIFGNLLFEVLKTWKSIGFEVYIRE